VRVCRRYTHKILKKDKRKENKEKRKKVKNKRKTTLKVKENKKFEWYPPD